MRTFGNVGRILIFRPHPWTLLAMLAEGGTRSGGTAAGEQGGEAAREGRVAARLSDPTGGPLRPPERGPAD